jgi:hypothetical protein
MTQPKSNDTEIHAMAEQSHGCAVPTTLRDELEA